MLPVKQIKQIIKEYLNGLSSIALAKKHGRSKTRILRILRDNNIERRSLSAALKKYELNDNFFTSINTESKAYWLGFLLGDGNIGDSGRNRKARQLRVTLQARDKGHLTKLKKDLSSSHPLQFLRSKNAYLLRITSKSLVEPIEDLWYKFKRSGNVRILDSVPNQMKRHLVRGLIDADGCLGIYNSRAQFGFIDLHKKVVLWVRSWLMQNADLNPIKIQHPSMAYRFSYSGNQQVARVCKILYNKSTIFLDRKKTLANSIIKLASVNLALKRNRPH